jgi:hypothetical protein
MPSALNLVPRKAGVAAYQTGGTLDTTVANVQAQDAQLGPYVEALNASITNCAAMSAADKTAWSGVYSQWQGYHQRAQALPTSEPSTAAALWLLPYAAYEAASTLAEASAIRDGFDSIRNQCATYSMKVSALCGAQSVPPPPPTPGSPGGGGDTGGGGGGGGGGSPKPSWLCSTFGINCNAAAPPSGDDWPTAIKYAAVAIVVVVGSIYLLPVALAMIASVVEHGKTVRGLLPAKEQ